MDFKHFFIAETYQQRGVTGARSSESTSATASRKQRKGDSKFPKLFHSDVLPRKVAHPLKYVLPFENEVFKYPCLREIFSFISQHSSPRPHRFLYML